MRERRNASRHRLAGIGLLALGIAVLGGIVWVRARDENRAADDEGAGVRAPGDTGSGPVLRATVPEPSAASATATASRSMDSSASPAGTPAVAAPAAVGATPPRSFAGAAAVLHVTLRLPEVWSRQEAKVYALPAGSPGAGFERDLPTVAVAPGASQVTLPLPALGLWDVGYVCIGLGHVLVTDVDVRGATEVTLEPRGARPLRVRVRATGALPSRGTVLVRSENGRTFPGRAEQPILGAEVALDGGDARETLPFAQGVPLSLRVWTIESARVVDGLPGTEWVLSRETALAGDEVELLVRPLGLVRNRLRVRTPLPESWTASWPTDPLLMIGARREGEPEARHFTSAFLHKDGRLQKDLLLLALAPGRYLLGIERWGAWTPDPGPRRPVEVRAGETIDLDWTVVPDAALPPFVTHPSDPIPTTQFLLRPQAPPRKRWVLAAEIERDGRVSWENGDGAWDGASALDVDFDQLPRRALLFLAPDRVSDVFVPRSGREQPVPMHPAGTLVVVPEFEPDKALGALRLRRTDGLPLALLEAEVDRDGSRDFRSVDTAPEVQLGSLLGPIAPGRIELEVLLGGVVVARLTPEVRAGVFTPLDIPLPSTPAR